MNNDLKFSVANKPTDYTLLNSSQISHEHLLCELQLSAIGCWEPLDFAIDPLSWQMDSNNLKDMWRPFQPKEGISNDRDSILLFGLEGDTATSPTGLSHVHAKLGYFPKEIEFTYPTEAVPLLTSCKEIIDYFDPMCRSFVIKLNAGGFYPRHRDHFLINRDTFRLITFLGDSSDQLEWEVEGNIKTFLPNTTYYVDTRKMHRLSSWSHGSTMVVWNVLKTWDNVLKVLTRLKHK
jgi:hypothetical protein